MQADDIIARLDLAPHPEGGHYRQSWAASAATGRRPAATCIYFLLRRGEVSRWHRVDADEIWLWHAGSPLTLSRAPDLTGPARDLTLGPDLANGAAPQLLVPAGTWQAARSQGDFTLVSCVVSPGFRFEGFTLMPEDFDIPR